jgi:hypothetical protein
MAGCKWHERQSCGPVAPKWRWGAGMSGAQRMRDFRKRKTRLELRFDTAVRVFRRAVKVGRGECKNSPDLRKQARQLCKPSVAAKVGASVYYIPVGSGNGALQRGVVVKTLKPKYSPALVIIKRCKRHDKRLKPYVAVSVRNVFVQKQ